MTKQEIYDTVVRHLQMQGKRCVDSKNTCLYRRGDMACAAGALIPQALYYPELEGCNLSGDKQKALFKKLGFTDKQMELLSELQVAHDHEPNWCWDIDPKSYLPKPLTDSLRNIATGHGLKPRF